MKIKLANPWYIDSTYYPVGEHTVSDDLYDKLPSSAEVVKTSIGKAAPVEEFVSLKELDVERSQGDREQAFVKGKK